MLILVIALIVLLYFSNIFSYSMGVKHGRIVKNNGVPNVNPIEKVRERKKVKEEEKKIDNFAEGLNNILAYGDKEGVTK